MESIKLKSLDELPCAGQTFETVKAWMKANAKPGVTVVIRQSQGGIWEYSTAKIVATSPRFIWIDQLPAWGADKYYYSGKSTRHPTSQTNLIVPTPEVMAAVENRIQFIQYL